MSKEFDEIVDVLIVGSGAAGCSAGVSASRNGCKRVLICEASAKMVGGTTKLAGGGWLWCPNNPFLRNLGLTQTPHEITSLLLDLAYPNKEEQCDPGDKELIEAFAMEWPEVLDTILKENVMKLQQVEVREQEDEHRMLELLLRKIKERPELKSKLEPKLDKLAKLMPSYCAEHPLDFCPTGKVLSPDGSTTSLQLEKSARKLFNKCEIRMDTRVIDIVFDKDRTEIIGAIVASENGKVTKRIRTLGGVVFASGGFAQNRKLLEANFGGKSKSPVGSCSAITNVGDFVEIAKKYQIPVSGMDLAWFKQVVLPYKFPKRLGVFFMNGDSYMVVDRTGNRFACDKDFYQQRGLQMFEREERRCVFFIFDERAWNLFEGPIKSLGSAYPTLEGNEDCVVQGKNEQELTSGLAQLLEKVCPGFKLDANFATNLKNQIVRFNKMAVIGKDTEFGRGENSAQYCWSVPRAKDNSYPNKTMYPLDTTKLCAVVLGLSVLDTKGGPRIDANGRVLNQQKKPIPGLYGAGNAVRSSTRHSYPASGVTLSNAIFFGWKAGADAAIRASENSRAANL
jgi:3-oxosteroid 1-dehydrogenase